MFKPNFLEGAHLYLESKLYLKSKLLDYLAVSDAMTNVNWSLNCSHNDPQKPTNFRRPEMHFQLPVDCFLTQCQVCFTDNLALETSLLFSYSFFQGGGGGLGTTKSPQKLSDFRWPEVHSELSLQIYCLFAQFQIRFIANIAMETCKFYLIFSGWGGEGQGVKEKLKNSKLLDLHSELSVGCFIIQC